MADKITSINGVPVETEAGTTALKFGEIGFWSKDGYLYTNGSYQVSNDTTLARFTNPIPVSPGDTVGVSMEFPEGATDRKMWLQYVLYDVEQNFVSAKSLINSSTASSYDGVFEIPDGAAYTAIQWMSYGDMTPRIKLSTAAVLPYAEIHSLDDELQFGLNEGFIYTNGSIQKGSQGDGQQKERYTDAIEIPPDRELDVSLAYSVRKAMWLHYALYDKDDNFLRRISLVNGSNRIDVRSKVSVTDASAAYIRITFYSWEGTLNADLTVKRSFYGRALASGGGGGGSTGIVRTLTPSDMTPGYAASASAPGGISSSSFARCCTRDLIPVCEGDTVDLLVNEYVYKWYAHVCDEAGNIYTSGWKNAGGKSFVVPANGFIRVTVSPADTYDKSFEWTDEAIAASAESIKITSSAQALELELHDMTATKPQPPIRLFGYPADVVIGDTDGYVPAMRDALDSLMAEYKGDARKIPFILTTDQHGGIKRYHRTIFDQLANMANWDEISFIGNLGDTIPNNWSGADELTDDPYMHHVTLENYRYATENLPHEKRLEVFGNHDTWGPNWDGKSSGLYALPSLKYLNQYFNDNSGRSMRCSDNSGNHVIYDPYFAVKYVCIADWDYTDPSASHSSRVSPEHWEWIIRQLSADDGYDVVLVSHHALDLTGDYARDLFTGEPKTGMSTKIYAPADAMFNARKAKGSGSFTDADGVTHSYDFTACQTDLLCGIAGHTHTGGYSHISGELLSVAFTAFTNSSDMWFGLFDRDGRKLKAWRVFIDSGADPTAAEVDSIEIPFDVD